MTGPTRGRPKSDPNSKRVVRARVCVAVNDEGEWSAVGEHDQDARWHVIATGDGLHGNIRFYWVWVDVEVPDPPSFRESGVAPVETLEFARIELDALLNAADTVAAAGRHLRRLREADPL